MGKAREEEREQKDSETECPSLLGVCMHCYACTVLAHMTRQIDSKTYIGSIELLFLVIGIVLVL